MIYLLFVFVLVGCGCHAELDMLSLTFRLVMNIDDQEMVNKMGRSGADVLTERPLYIGGTDFSMSDRLVSSTARFSGCMSDFTINGE